MTDRTTAAHLLTLRTIKSVADEVNVTAKRISDGISRHWFSAASVPLVGGRHMIRADYVGTMREILIARMKKPGAVAISASEKT